MNRTLILFSTLLTLSACSQSKIPTYNTRGKFYIVRKDRTIERGSIQVRTDGKQYELVGMPIMNKGDEIAVNFSLEIE
jgi:hypothetical protein